MRSTISGVDKAEYFLNSVTTVVDHRPLSISATIADLFVFVAVDEKLNRILSLNRL